MDVHCLFFQPRDDFQGRFGSSVAVLPETLGYSLPYPRCEARNAGSLQVVKQSVERGRKLAVNKRRAIKMKWGENRFQPLGFRAAVFFARGFRSPHTRRNKRKIDYLQSTGNRAQCEPYQSTRNNHSRMWSTDQAKRNVESLSPRSEQVEIVGCNCARVEKRIELLYE